jgi:hypothetical protein
MPDVIEVKIQYAPNVLKTLLVAVVRDLQKKPFLGGFRHKTTSVDYLHASTQTFNPKEPVDPATLPIKYHRNSQTSTCQTRSSQCVRECGTQMDKPGLFVSTERDLPMAARDYFDSEQLFALQLKKTIVIQCYVRGYVVNGMSVISGIDGIDVMRVARCAAGLRASVRSICVTS